MILLSLGCENSFMVQPEVFGEIPENIKETYPGLISKYKKRKHVSLSQKRIGNDFIVRKLLEWVATEKYKYDDIFVLISWTDPRRKEFCWERPQETQKVNWPNVDEIFNSYWPDGVYEYTGFCRRYLKLYNEYHINEEYEHTLWANQIILTESLLTNNNIDYLFVNSFSELKCPNHFKNIISKFNYHNPFDFNSSLKGYANNLSILPGPLGFYNLDLHTKFFKSLMGI